MTLTLEKDGKIILPEQIRRRYGFNSETVIRIIETSEGVLLMPLENEKITDELKAELEDWQNLSQESWEIFTYEAETL